MRASGEITIARLWLGFSARLQISASLHTYVAKRILCNPKKVETTLVLDFIKESFDVFEKKMDGKFDEVRTELRQEIQKVEKKVDIIGSLITNTHQEVKHFVELHKLLDGKVSNLEHRVARLEELVKA